MEIVLSWSWSGERCRQHLYCLELLKIFKIYNYSCYVEVLVRGKITLRGSLTDLDCYKPSYLIKLDQIFMDHTITAQRLDIWSKPMLGKVCTAWLLGSSNAYIHSINPSSKIIRLATVSQFFEHCSMQFGDTLWKVNGF